MLKALQALLDRQKKQPKQPPQYSAHTRHTIQPDCHLAQCDVDEVLKTHLVAADLHVCLVRCVHLVAKAGLEIRAGAPEGAAEGVLKKQAK